MKHFKKWLGLIFSSNEEPTELTDDELMQVVGGSKLSAALSRENRGRGGGRGPWG